MSINLPAGFEDLQPFVGKWALPTEFERAAARRSAKPDELEAFYQAMVSRVEEILERADKYPLGKIEGSDRLLYLMALSLAEVAPHVEFYKCNPSVPYAFEEVRMKAVHEHIPD